MSKCSSCPVLLTPLLKVEFWAKTHACMSKQKKKTNVYVKQSITAKFAVYSVVPSSAVKPLGGLTRGQELK